MTTDNDLYYGQTDLTSDQGDWNKLRFAIQQQILKMATCLPVEVLSVQAAGVAPVGTVSIKILVDQVTGDGKTIPHGEITNVPYVRIQGGANAVIIDPKVGDIGMACFASRDISAVKSVRKQAPPGSKRAFDFSDAIYIGGMLNSTPVQFIHFTDAGIVITSPQAVIINAPITTVNGHVHITGNLDIDGTTIGNGINLNTHRHTGVQTGGGNTGLPTT